MCHCPCDWNFKWAYRHRDRDSARTWTQPFPAVACSTTSHFTEHWLSNSGSIIEFEWMDGKIWGWKVVPFSCFGVFAVLCAVFKLFPSTFYLISCWIQLGPSCSYWYMSFVKLYVLICICYAFVLCLSKGKCSTVACLEPWETAFHIQHNHNPVPHCKTQSHFRCQWVAEDMEK